MLLLADGRFPAGGHTHSGGMEVAVADGQQTLDADVRLAQGFLFGRPRPVRADLVIESEPPPGPTLRPSRPVGPYPAFRPGSVTKRA